jgi:hypothetical protein
LKSQTKDGERIQTQKQSIKLNDSEEEKAYLIGGMDGCLSVQQHPLLFDNSRKRRRREHTFLNQRS